MDPIEVTVVLVSGSIGDYAAYVGVGSEQYVKLLGNKLCFEEAQVHFPIGLQKDKYRE